MPEATRTIETPRMVRTATFVRAEADDEKRTVPLSFSSEDPVRRYFGTEVLDHKKSSVDLSFLDGGRAPLLSSHDSWGGQIGVIEKAWIEDKHGKAVVRFGNSERAQVEFQDVKDGIRQNVSVGYSIQEMVLEKEVDGVKMYRAMRWKPLEVSLVSIPADQTDGVGVGRSDSAKPYQTIVRGEEVMPEKKVEKKEPVREEAPKTVPAIDTSAATAEARKDEVNRIRDITELSKQPGLEALGQKAIDEGWSVSKFRAEAWEILTKRSETETVSLGENEQRSPYELGMGRQERAKYSILRLLRAVVFNDQPQYVREAAFELDCHEQIVGRMTTQPKGIMIPNDALGMYGGKRLLDAGTAGGAPELIGTDHLGAEFIDVLRNAMLIFQLGARSLTGLVGNVNIPRKASGSSAGWVADDSTDVAESDMATETLALTPKTLGAYTSFTRQLLLQSDPSVDALVRDDLAMAVALGIDAACYNGTGANGQPTGIKATTNVGKPTADFVGATPTWAELLTVLGLVATANAPLSSSQWVLHPEMMAKCMGAQKADSTGQWLYENKMIAGYGAPITGQVAAADIFFGVWSEIIVGFWGGVSILSDPYTLGLSGAVRVIVHQSCDVGLRHPAAMAYNSATIS